MSRKAGLEGSRSSFWRSGWFPLLVALVTFTILTTWAAGRRLLRARLEENAMPLPAFIKSAAPSLHRVSGTSVFMSATPNAVPSALLHNVKHNQVLHERVIILTVEIEEILHVEESGRVAIDDCGEGFFRTVLHYGFMEEPDVPRDLARIDRCGPRFDMMSTSFYLGRQKPIAAKRPGMAPWREHLFAWMMKARNRPWNSSGSPPTASSSSAAGSKSEERRSLPK